MACSIELHVSTPKATGTPVSIAEPDGPHAKVYADIAARVKEAMETETATHGAPAIVFE